MDRKRFTATRRGIRLGSAALAVIGAVCAAWTVGRAGASAPSSTPKAGVTYERYVERQPVTFVTDDPTPKREVRTETVEVWARSDGSGRVRRSGSTGGRLGSGPDLRRPGAAPRDVAVQAGSLSVQGDLADASDADSLLVAARAATEKKAGVAGNPAAAFDKVMEVASATGATPAQRRTAVQALERIPEVSSPEPGVLRITERGDGRVIDREVRIDSSWRLVSDTSTLVEDPGGTFGTLPLVVYSRTTEAFDQVADVPEG